MTVRRAAAAFAGVLVSLAAVAQATDPAAAKWNAGLTEGWSITWPEAQAKLTYRGVVNMDGAGLGPGAILYPAPNAAGFLAAILTHAAISEGAKSSQKAAIQAEADKVLLDYRPSLEGFAPEDLMRRTAAALRTVSSFRESGDGSWSLEVQPLFWLTQDRRALIVDSVVTVRARIQRRGEAQRGAGRRIPSACRHREYVLVGKRR